MHASFTNFSLAAILSQILNDQISSILLLQGSFCKKKKKRKITIECRHHSNCSGFPLHSTCLIQLSLKSPFYPFEIESWGFQRVQLHIFLKFRLMLQHSTRPVNIGSQCSTYRNMLHV